MSSRQRKPPVKRLSSLKLSAVGLLFASLAFGESAPGITPEEADKAAREAQAVEDLVQLADSIGAKVAAMRGLPFKKPVRKGIQSREQLRDYLLDLMARKQPKERFDAISRAYAMLGLMPKGLDLQKVVLDLLEEQVAGFYDPEAKALFLISEWNLSQQSIISHELMHAIQDQHFDLQSLPMEDETREDAMNAVKSVVEGEGMLIMMQFIAKSKGADLGLFEKLMKKGYEAFLLALDTRELDMASAFEGAGGMMVGGGKLASVPVVVREGLIFPYLNGLVFVHQAWKKGGWKSVSALYSDMPQSTEQVMHPEKYFRVKDRPTIIEVSEPKSLAPQGYDLIYHSVLGELYVSVLMREFLGPKASRRSWQGWDGDHFFAFHDPKRGGEFFLWATVWDSARDAEEFAAAYDRVEAARRAGTGKTGTKTAPTNKDEEGKAGAPAETDTPYLLQRRGTEVLIGRGSLSREELGALLAEVWQKRKLKEAEPVRAKGAVEE